MAVTVKLGEKKVWKVNVGVASNGTRDHNKLGNRDAPGQHPMSAIPGLESALMQKAAAKDLESHVGDDDNPHGVTAEQVGARPNTWMPTIAQIGAAPAGYGLGGDANHGMPPITDANTATRNGWYHINTATANTPGVNGVMRADSYTEGSVMQTIFCTSWSASYHAMFQRVCLNGTWQEWDWVDPPMVLGVEYRTTERWQDKAVYTKLIDCGKMPNNTQVAIPHGISMDKAIRHCGYGGTSTIPYSTTVWNPTATTHSVDVVVSTYAIYIRTNYDASAESAMIQLWYTKD